MTRICEYRHDHGKLKLNAFNMLRFKIQFQFFAKMDGIDVKMGNELLLITTWPT
jgi:hypothetical protein